MKEEERRIKGRKDVCKEGRKEGWKEGRIFEMERKGRERLGKRRKGKDR